MSKSEQGPSYTFNGSNASYNVSPASRKEITDAYESAPACHHPGRSLGEVSMNSLGTEEWAAIVAHQEAADFNPGQLLEEDDSGEQ